MTPEVLLDHYDRGAPWPLQRTAFTDLAAAYQTALRLRALREQRGERVVGYKVGFTNRSIWDRYQVFAPIWGPVWNTTLVHHHDGQGQLSLAATALPRLEPEVVFGLRRTPPAQPTAAQVFDCIDWIAPGFEVVQSHCADWKFSAADTVADGALHARLLLGSQRPVRELASDAQALHTLLAAARLELLQGDALVDHGPGANVLDSPLQALRHFIHEFQRLPQPHALRPGDVVTTGTWTDAWPVQAGQTWRLRFDTDLAPLRVHFR